MPKTRKEESSVEEESNAGQPQQVEIASNDTPTSSGPNVEKKDDDVTAKARDRQARFKALQARAVSSHMLGSGLRNSYPFPRTRY